MANKGEPNFNAPIPGMSLTTEPGNRPWENPPQYTDMEDVIEYYLQKVGDEESIDSLMGVLENGLPVNTLVDSLITSGSMFGLHTVESGLMAAPVIAEFIEALADIEGIEYKVSAKDKDKRMPPEEARELKKMLDKEVATRMEGGISPAGGEGEDSMEDEEGQAAEMEMPERKGLMARRPMAEDEMMTDEMSEEEVA
jgi:hypothetical protein